MKTTRARVNGFRRTLVATGMTAFIVMALSIVGIGCADSPSSASATTGGDAAASMASTTSRAGDAGPAQGLGLFGRGRDGSVAAPAALYFNPPSATVTVDGTGPRKASFT